MTPKVLRLLPLLALLAACGEGPAVARPSTSPRSALTGAPELLEFEPVATRQALYLELARQSRTEAGEAARPLSLFPLGRGGELVAAPGLEAGTDLLDGAAAGAVLRLTFDAWPEERRESLQGLSEREAAELVARTLLVRWGVQTSGAVQVERAPGAPYAAAYVDGLLRLNPAFLYLAAAFGNASSDAGVQ